MLSEAVHGSVDNSELEQLGIDASSIIDFSTTVNPFGPSPKAVAALADVRLDCYPDRESLELRRVLARRLAVSDEQLIAGNGSSELLQLISLAYLRPVDTVMIIGPTYSEYARSAAVMGARCLYCNATVETDFAIPVENITQMLCSTCPRIVYLCNPNNPTGQFVSPASIAAWAHEFDQTLFVVDEAYIEFVSTSQPLAGFQCRNVVILRSLTKAFGLAGLRLGYLIADPDIVRTLCSLRVPWSVNIVAQVAGVAALQDDQHQQSSLAQLVESKQNLIANLRSLGLNPLSSTTLFFLLAVADSARTRFRLIQSGILVRDCSSFGLPGFIRIGTRCPTDNARLINALTEMKLTGRF